MSTKALVVFNHAAWIEEELLAQRLGIDREKTRAARPKSAQRRRNAVYWPIAAARAFALGLRLTLPEPPKNAPPGDGSEVLTVHSSPGANGYHFGAHLIRALREDGQTVVDVQVTDSRKFRPRLANGEPMTFRARKEERFHYWRLTGREPRYPGFW